MGLFLAMSGIAGGPREAVEEALREWDLNDERQGKAYEDDEFAYLDCWQLTDFMRKLWLLYPTTKGTFWERRTGLA